MAPRIDSISDHQIYDQTTITLFGSGFAGAQGVQVGSDWAPDFRVDGDTVIGVTLPHLAGGSTNWVIVHGADGSTSPCEGDAQLITMAAPIDPPPGALRLDSMTPETIALGRADTYWLQGTGLSKAKVVTVGDRGCAFDAYDDTRIVVHVPEELRNAQDGAAVEVFVSTSDNVTATLQVQCVAPLPPEPEYTGAYMDHIDPAELGPEGGRFTIYGSSLQFVHVVAVGNLTATLEDTAHDHVTATVGSLADYAGQSVMVDVVDKNGSTGQTDRFITVRASS